MKCFIFACLLAVALAKPNMEQYFSSEETLAISQEQFKQDKNVVEFPTEENICTTSCEEPIKSTRKMVNAEVPKEMKYNEFYQKLDLLQYLQALYQYPMVMNPWTQPEMRTLIPTMDREQLSNSEEFVIFPQRQYEQEMDVVMQTSEEIPETTADMESTEVFTQKTEMTAEEKNLLKYLDQMNQYYQFTLPQYLQDVRHFQKTMTPWNYFRKIAYQSVPTLRYL
ncbi:alpha-S2-casein-like isoform X1 [Ochotona curzoniae]|uniref:alpha-S2-casein-like isoform X1 n=1 Tax=Ochotona curzoniae TaxID=130825 RepID=UPI001B34BD66|nr:alpha-S2-casein-like isoform X1 [Ochotona curzoniae]